MSDLERRVIDALEAGATRAPDVAGVADRARERARRRARTTAVAVVTAVVVVVAAVPTVLALTHGHDSAGPTVVDTPTPSPALPSGPPSEPAPSAPESPPATTTPTVPASATGWRTETYRDLEIQVPSSWGNDELADVCNAEHGLGTPMVEQPFRIDDLMLCERPGTGYGARFVDRSSIDLDLAHDPGVLVQVVDPPSLETGFPDFPVGSWSGYQLNASGDTFVFIDAPDRSVAQRVLDSARTVEGADGNGCAVDSGGPATVDRGSVAVCTYDPDGVLVRSELITGKAADAVVSAIDDAPADDRPSGCADRPRRIESVVLREPSREARVVFGSECRPANGVRIGDERRRITAELAYWALSPGVSVGISEEIATPDQLR